MRLSQAEVRQRAVAFAAEWKDASNEQAEAQSFWTDLFNVYGIKRRSVASFEEKVRNVKGANSRIDVFYSGVMIGEHKSRGEDLTKAKSQAFEYVQSLTREQRHNEIPQYIVLSDFETIVVFDLDAENPGEPVVRFPTTKLHENVRHLGFLAGQTMKPIDPEDPINIKAVGILGELHDALEQGGYTGHALERFLVRILFCLFADDTTIFEPDTFKVIVKESRENGFGLGAILHQFFEILDTPKDARKGSEPEEFSLLPYVNGDLFKEPLPVVNFNKTTRDVLLRACEFNWARISPAVFGSLFQSIMAGTEGARRRRQIGAHYTSERDIMKLIRSLFLDDLEAELKACGSDDRKLKRYQKKLAGLKFLDPACGCGNFLVITYRELRRLELEAIAPLLAKGFVQHEMDATRLLMVQVDQMHGIEIEEWPARIAEVAMWLIDHQMNTLASEQMGLPVYRLPLTRSARIHHGNALTSDWNTVLSAQECSFVLGNPPFLGKKEQNAGQKADFQRVWADVKGSGVLDFVTCWYRLAARYIQGSSVRVAFVSTNSICQGEQVAVLWGSLFTQGIQIHFAHRTFKWESEARGAAHVHVIIIGFAVFAPARRVLVEYDPSSGHPIATEVRRINPYLVDGPDVLIYKRSTPISNAPEMSYGSMMIDKDRKNKLAKGLILTEDERSTILNTCPQVEPYILRLYGSDEYINGEIRWCLWLVNAPPGIVRGCSALQPHLDAVRRFRESSSRPQTKELASTPGLFGEIRQPSSRYLLVPKVSSEHRRYIPIGFLDSSDIASGSALVIAGENLYVFGVLTSAIHMAWIDRVCGRLESRYQYSARLVYNNFPWPESPTDAQKAAVEEAAQIVIDARAQFPGQTLANMYDPDHMPPALSQAHRALDKAVDRCYRRSPFDSERARVEYLFDLYQQLTAPLTTKPTRPKAKKTRKKA